MAAFAPPASSLTRGLHLPRLASALPGVRLPLRPSLPLRSSTAPASHSRAVVAAAGLGEGRGGEAPAAEGPGRETSVAEAFVEAHVARYLRVNPTSLQCLQVVQSWNPPSPLSFDHLAFRSFGVDGLGIEAAAGLLEGFGYERRDSLHFPAKKLRAFWFSPPPPHAQDSLPLESTLALPRVFVSELAVEELSPPAQDIIRRFTGAAASLARHAFALSPLAPLPWPRPSSLDYLTLARESEYAAWTLVNGFSLNHTTISVHRLPNLPQPSPHLNPGRGASEEDPAFPIHRLNSLLEGQGVKLNQQGGAVKVSPDGLLLQSSTVADSSPFSFSDGVSLPVPVSYMEFALRLPLPQFSHLPPSQVGEHHRREGFEVGNADKIFESTSSTQGKGS